ncbi:MAG: type II secretion system F family protein [Candidatus Aenigmarchaeota archaeon]|nr:type II secretion system F family protein [Candidatus Aenigmarchaeota archaeon]
MTKKKKSRPLGLKKISLISFAAGSALLYVNILLFSSETQIFAIFNLIAAVIVLGIPLTIKFKIYRNIKEIEAQFPKYLRDIAQNIGAGMTLPQAIKSTLVNNYGVLNPYIKEVSAKISWGVSFEKAMHDFAVKTKSTTMRRNIQTIIETHRSGGQIDTILVSVAQSLQELEKIKKERSASVYAQMINGYLIYIVFLGVMIGLATVLIPAFRLEETLPDLQKVFVDMFRSLTVIQGFFAGIAIGKMAEGTLIAGLKHSMVLVIFGYSAFLIFV